MAEDDSEIPKTFRHAAKHRICVEMLRGIKGTGSPWKVLVTDEITVKVMSSACKVADITEENISVVEDLNKRRQPLANLDAVYFIQPSKTSVAKLVEDMGGRDSLYRRAFVFFSSALPRELLAVIKSNQVLLTRLAALREMNLEYIAMDSQAFITDSDTALEVLFGENSDSSPDFQKTIEDVASRLSTVFASLREFPAIRYRKAKASGDEGKLTARDLVPTKVASALWDRLRAFRALPGFPTNESCDLLILDRSFDAIAPVIHEWTYDAMCHDLLNLGSNNKYEYEVQTGGGKTEHKEVLLDEHDSLWMELRDLHIAEVNQRLSDKGKQFSQNKAAQVKSGERGEDVKTKEMRDLVKNLQSGFLEQKAKLSLHVDLASNLNTRMRNESLTDIGGLEQDLIFGDATSKELINLVSSRPDMKVDDKVRLLMIYATTHPDKLDATKRLQWMKLMRLSAADMHCINNLEYLGVSVAKKQSGGIKLGFGAKKAKKPARKEREDEQTYSLSRFTPLVMDLVEEMAEGKLSAEEYPFVKQPSGGDGAGSRTGATSARASARTARTSNWAAKDDRAKPTSAGDVGLAGRRILVFIVGGMTHSEVRAAHKLTDQLKREVILGSTTLDTPSTFLQGMRKLARLEDVAL